MTHPEILDLVADFVLRIRRNYPRITLEFFDTQRLANRAFKLHSYLTKRKIRNLSPRYFDFVLNSCSFSDWKLLFVRAATQEMVDLFIRSLE